MFIYNIYIKIVYFVFFGLGGFVVFFFVFSIKIWFVIFIFEEVGFGYWVFVGWILF